MIDIIETAKPRWGDKSKKRHTGARRGGITLDPYSIGGGPCCAFVLSFQRHQLQPCRWRIRIIITYCSQTTSQAPNIDRPCRAQGGGRGPTLIEVSRSRSPEPTRCHSRCCSRSHHRLHRRRPHVRRQSIARCGGPLRAGWEGSQLAARRDSRQTWSVAR